MFGVPLKFKRDIVPWFVTPCGILPQHDQTDPISYHMEGKSWLVLLCPWRLTARHSSCPVCLLCRDDWLFLIQGIDASVLTDLYWLGNGLARPLDSEFYLLSGLQDGYLWGACNEWGMWAYLLIAKPAAINHLEIHYNCS